MALANFFDKINLGASQRLKDYDRSAFETKLLSNCICVRFAVESIRRYEGQTALDLLVRLLARLYPNIKFHFEGDSQTYESYIDRLKGIAREINPVINLSVDQAETFIICVGSVLVSQDQVTTFYIGSDNWKAFYSTTTEQSIGETQNPFGAASAASIVCANLFRAIFFEELGRPALDIDLSFSAFSQTINPTEHEPDIPQEVVLDFTLIGAGAIGNTALWALLQMLQAKGNISLIDKEAVSLSNLQRYILMFQRHVNHSKVENICELFKSQNQINIHPYAAPWQEVVGALPVDQCKLVAVALDTTNERLQLQASLPKKIINAWTSPDCIGVSRHFDFVNDVCLACLYLPSEKVKSESEKIAEALNMTSSEPFIRQYLAKNIPIDEQFINVVSQFGGISAEKLNAYNNQPVRVLYSDGICGGRLIPVQSEAGGSQDVEVPLAHESAMAGILLAAEVVIESCQLRRYTLEPITKINLSRPLHQYLLEKEHKHYSGKCLCQDQIFQSRYNEKWNNNNSIS